METLFSDDDVKRWDIVYRAAISLHLEKLATGLSQQQMDFHLSNLSGSYLMQGMAFVAQRKFNESIVAFHASAETRCKMYERFENGEGRKLEAGHFQSVLIAFVTRDHELTSRLASHYSAEEGTPDSIFLGRVIKCLAMRDNLSAKKALDLRRPRFEPQFVGYAECLDGIASKDTQRIVSALALASENWSKWASNKAKGLPDSVCFIQGIGLLRLAESVLDTSLPFVNEHMPPALLLSEC